MLQNLHLDEKFENFEFLRNAMRKSSYFMNALYFCVYAKCNEFSSGVQGFIHLAIYYLWNFLTYLLSCKVPLREIKRSFEIHRIGLNEFMKFYAIKGYIRVASNIVSRDLFFRA